MNKRPITEDDLHAFVDKALDAERYRDVAAFLDTNEEAAKRVASYQMQAAGLRSALEPTATEPVPSRLNLANIIEMQRPAGRPRVAQSAAAAIVLLAIGASGGWLVKGYSMPPTEGVSALAQEASASYSAFAGDRLRPVEVRADGTDDLKLLASETLGGSVAIPDLTKAGYRLMGGRVIPTFHGSGFMLMYDNDRGSRLVMLTRRMKVDQDKQMVASEQRDIRGWSWASRGLGYSLVGAIGSQELHPIADEMRSQI
ncbi:anti-sigma factor [Rhizobium sophorae]|uniref:Anti-sigma factor n=1 Tax=Rhizobium sophorae TaxID=1535242 RepID=A0A7Y3S7M0_9HYPH|nr:anti-sigma factor [Rhizobium sophorae]NNU38599.1 anti-sigma factor [Rhizobium sophorae]